MTTKTEERLKSLETRIESLETSAQDNTVMLFNLGPQIARLEEVFNARLDGIVNMQQQMTNVAKMTASAEVSQQLKQQRLDCDVKMKKNNKSKFGWAHATTISVALIALIGILVKTWN